MMIEGESQVRALEITRRKTKYAYVEAKLE